MSELTKAMAELSDGFREVQRAIGEQLLPAMQELGRELRRLYNSWPGMPYTAPSLWDAEQMRADR